MVVVKFCNFCSITGLLSISNNRYDPPCKSKPRFIFLSNNLLLKLKRLEDAMKIKNKETNKIKNIFNFEKYNTLFQKNYFFTS
jgi:hypothetical protein